MQTTAAIFLIDDEESIRKSLGRLLGVRGFLTQGYASGEECLDALQVSRGPACVIADLRLPGMSGSELLRTLPSHYPFIMLIGYADVSAAVATMQAGALDVLEKPVHEGRLFASLDNALFLAQQLYEQHLAHAALRLKFDRLTPREKEVMGLVTNGLRNKEVARLLGTVEKTIKVHRARITEKLELKSLAEMVRCADRLGIVGRSENPIVARTERPDWIRDDLT